MDEILFEKQNSYFKDGLRKVDFVLVITKVSAIENEEILTIFLRNLQNMGIELEQSFGILHAVLFVKLHLPLELWTFMRVRYPLWDKVRAAHAMIYKLPSDGFGVFETPLAYMDPTKAVDYCGRIFFIDKVLKLSKFGEETSERGVDELIRKKIVTKAYGLHDGFIQKDLDNDEDLNVRSLLRKYWGNLNAFYKGQSLDFIKNYYGVEIAFYFAFLEFYANMTIFPVILSIVTIFYSVVNYYTNYSYRDNIRSLCQRQTPLCGSCILGHKCLTAYFPHRCELLKYTLLFDNLGTMLYSITMSIWASFVLSMWDKREKELIKRWKLSKFQLKADKRTEFKEKVPYRRKSRLTGTKKGYMPWPVFLGKKIVVFTCCVVTVTILVLVLWLNVNFMIGVKMLLKDNWNINLDFHDEIIYIIQYCFMTFSAELITKVVIMLCNFESHKYQTRYDNQFLIMRYLFRSLNQFSVLFYFAIGKGLVYNIPYPQKSSHLWGFLIYDEFQPNTCFLTLLLVQTFRAFCNLIGPVLGILIAVLKKATKSTTKVILHQYENEYLLESVNPFSLPTQFIKIMTLHGSLTMFSFANYFAPLFYWLTILVIVRIEAYRFVKIYKRPIPKIIHNLASWRQILMFITYTSIFVNSVGLIFSSELPYLYEYTTGSFKGYLNYTLSEFDMHEINPKIYPNNSICWYRNMRYHPYHTKRYQKNQQFWKLFTYQNLSVIFMIKGVYVAVLISKKIASAIWKMYSRKK
ncbi:unnamed protein product [Brassicogethes aeneus]|uniref:Anoctamin n=1 Tax=Brassicogethes aeneus TaxID=1431903 RepID=A0A9P0B2G7_BRAAE|nr:unnamed protein product [Brassicogethes aeneus]